jgi:hypothetical protein
VIFSLLLYFYNVYYRLKPTHAQVWEVPPTWGMCLDFMGNEIMNNVSQQVMKGEKITQSKELI